MTILLVIYQFFFISFHQVDAVPSPEVSLNIFYNMLRKADNSEERDRILTMISDEHKVSFFC